MNNVSASPNGNPPVEDRKTASYPAKTPPKRANNDATLIASAIFGTGRISRLFSKTEYRASWASMLRIGLITTAFLLLIGALRPFHLEPLPWSDVGESQRVMAMLHSHGDPRGFRSLDDFKYSTRTKVTWISSSATQVIYPMNPPDGVTEVNEFLPMRMRDSLESTFGNGVDVLYYLHQAGTIIEKYFSLVHSFNSSSSLHILEINPGYDFSGNVLSRRKLLPTGNASDYLQTDTFSDAAMAMLYVSPAGFAWNAIQRHFPVLRNRWSYSKQLSKRLRIRLPWPAVRRKVNHHGTDGDVRPGSMDNHTFWASYWPVQPDNSFGYYLDYNSDNSVVAISNIAAGIVYSSPHPQARGYEWVEAAIAKLAQSGKPAIVYLSPAAPSMLQNKGTRLRYEEIQEAVIGFARRYRYSSNLCIIGKFEDPRMQDLVFQDDIHLRRSEPMASILSDIIDQFWKDRACPDTLERR